MPLIRENSMDGVGSRVLELYGRPIADESTARELHQISERHYGHAGKRFIEYLAEAILSEEDKLEELYREMKKRLREAYGRQHAGEPGLHFDNIAVLSMGDFLSSMSVFTVDWIGANTDHFRPALYRGVTRYGALASGYVNIIQSVFRKALEGAGFSYAKSVRGFISRGWFDSFTDADGKRRSQYQCKIDGVNMRVFRCRLDVEPDDDSDDDFLN